MYMGDSYYSRQIERLERERIIAALAMNTAISFISFKNERIRNKLRDRIRNLTSSSLDKATSMRKKLTNDLKKVESKSFITSFDVEDLLKNNQSRYQIKLDYRELQSIARTIADDPVAALKEYSLSYNNTRRQIEQLKKDQEESKKAEEERKREQARQQIREYEEPVSTPTSYYEPRRTEPVKKVPYLGTTDDESRKLLQESIDKEIANKYGFIGFSYDEEKRIKELYPELSSSMGYYSVKTLEKGVRINNIATKADVNTDEIMEMGLLTFEVVTKELLENNRFKSVDIFNKIGMNNCLEKYKTAYKKYQNYYKKLSPEQKDKIKEQIKGNKRYANMFNDQIASPELLTAVINIKVSNYIVENYFSFYNYEQKDFYMKTSHATKYMSIQEIVSLYKRIEFKERERGIYTQNDEDRRLQEQSKREYLEQLQRDFANVILSRLESYNKQVDYFKMSDIEKEVYNRETQEKLAAIINDLFKEQPLSASLQESAKSNEVGRGENLVETYESKKQAHTQVFGLSRIKKAFAKISGKWSKYLMLMDKDELSKTEQEQLKGMFR